jgi:hypothetical protein
MFVLILKYVLCKFWTIMMLGTFLGAGLFEERFFIYLKKQMPFVVKALAF